MPDGGGTGYNIPISVSAAETFSIPQNTEAGTVFNFASPYATGIEGVTQEANPNDPATATSSAAEGNAQSASSGSGVNATNGIPPAGSPPNSATSILQNINWTYVLIGSAVVLLAIIAVKQLKK